MCAVMNWSRRNVAAPTTRAASVRSQGLTHEQLAALRHRQPTATIGEHATDEGDRFVSVARPDRRQSYHITALDGHFVVFHGEGGEVLAQGSCFLTVIERAGL
jgi:hypothetical protein